MKLFSIQTLLLLLIVIVNLPLEFIQAYNIQPLAATVTLTLILIVISYIAFRQQQIQKKEMETLRLQAEKPTEAIQPESMPEQPISLGECITLPELLNYLKDHADNPSAVTDMEKEMKTYQQCYIWVKRMEELYGKAWRKQFQELEMPPKPEDFPQMRSLILEIALHTVDFCRYRTNYINLTKMMRVNPSMILLKQTAKEAGGEAYEEDPFKVPKETRALHALTEVDDIRLKQATLHGYYENNQIEL